MKRIDKNKKNNTKNQQETCSIVLKPVTSVAVAPVRSEEVSIEALLGSVPRAARFITALQLYEGLLDRLRPAGMTDEEVEEGLSLLNFKIVNPPVPAKPKPSAAGITGCEAFLATELVLAHGKVMLRFGDQASYLFEGLDEHARGMEAVLTVGLFVQRCRNLADAPERAETRERDHGALAAIATVGVTPEKLDALDAFALLARTIDPPAPTGPTWEEQRAAALRKLHTWITVWSEQARRVLTRKDDLRRLGLLKRRHKKAQPAPAPVVPAPAVPLALRSVRDAVNAVEEEAPSSRAAGSPREIEEGARPHVGRAPSLFSPDDPIARHVLSVARCVPGRALPAEARECRRSRRPRPRKRSRDRRAISQAARAAERGRLPDCLRSAVQMLLQARPSLARPDIPAEYTRPRIFRH
jgi:hypothetical protein